MTEVITANTDAQRLLAEILARYGSMQAFFDQLQRELDGPTEELPRVTEPVTSPWADPAEWPIRPVPTGGGGRHARKDG
ncbi:MULTISPECIES: hypothetical protein [unclassified Nocardia]|uniref:hypothetical protein n=1 Tax=unclassified Nocardia TaxID=2637762 RepID=UPI0024A8B70D|nr:MULTISPECIES: hypothetical protein [unclassified Nocardia]